MAEPVKAATITIRSIGCRTNQEEMEALSAALFEEGYRIVDATEDADIIIVNTCSVTAATESRTRRFLKKLNAAAPQAKICVTGCLAQQDPDELLNMQGVSWVVGNRLKGAIQHLLRTTSGGIHTGAFSDKSKELLEISTVMIPPDAPGKHRTRFSVKIQEGCDFHCSYCIVPRLRGPSRSASVETVTAVCRKAVSTGYKEIVLTGTHIGQFTHQAEGGLPELLDRLLLIEGDFRIRLSSLDPRDCTDELLGYIGASKKVCSHVHVSLQNCSPEVLGAMRRPVDPTIACIERLAVFRKQYPLAGIGADLIVGFPGETPERFDETCRACTALELSYAHVFRFSSRPGTPAALLTETVSESEKTARSDRLREIVRQSRTNFIKKVGPVPQRIIVESVFPVRGVTSNYLHVELPGGNVPCNSWMEVLVRGASLHGRYCPAQPVLRKVA
ncbi:MAG: MiaB/RimO family radical SAM methylthiotransferase [Chitinispirillaceae bacterium]|nr:MiaB/RimO family radical SAM methylthiotransferase [Chitinispirillaceae bacterium]